MPQASLECLVKKYVLTAIIFQLMLSLVFRENPDYLAFLVNQVRMDCLDYPDLKENRDMANLDFLDFLDKRETPDHPERLDCLVHKVLLVRSHLLAS